LQGSTRQDAFALSVTDIAIAMDDEEQERRSRLLVLDEGSVSDQPPLPGS
jgi:hypothetical protein